MYNATLKVFTVKWVPAQQHSTSGGNKQAKQWVQVNYVNSTDAWCTHGAPPPPPPKAAPGTPPLPSYPMTTEPSWECQNKTFGPLPVQSDPKPDSVTQPSWQHPHTGRCKDHMHHFSGAVVRWGGVGGSFLTHHGCSDHGKVITLPLQCHVGDPRTVLAIPSLHKRGQCRMCEQKRE